MTIIPDSADILHNDYLKPLLESMDISFEAVCRQLESRETAVISPPDIYDVLLDAYLDTHPQARPEYKKHADIIKQMARNGINIDSGFEMYAREEAPLMLAFAHLQTHMQTRPYAVLSLDIDNLRGTNEWLDHSTTDRLVHRCMHIMKQHFLGAGGQIEMVRTGGDEVTAIISDIEPDALNKISSEAQTDIRALIEKCQLNRVPHQKEQYAEDAKRMGFGVSSAIVPLTASPMNAQTLEALHSEGIEQSKIEQGVIRLKASRAQTKKDISYAAQVRSKRKNGEDIGGPPIKNEAITLKKKKALAVVNTEDWLDTLDASEPIQMPPPSIGWPQSLLPKETNATFASAENIHEAGVMSFLEGEEPDSPKSNLFNMALSLNQKPGDMGIAGTRSMHEDFERYIKTAVKRQDGQTIVAQVRIQNMAGLNKELQPYGANQLIKRSLKLLEQSLKDNLPNAEELHCYYRSNGETLVLAHGVTLQEMQHALNKTAKHVDAEVNDESIKDIRNPRIGKEDMRGTGLEYVALEMPEVHPTTFYLEKMEFLLKGVLNQKSHYNHENLEGPWLVGERGTVRSSGVTIDLNTAACPHKSGGSGRGFLHKIRDTTQFEEYPSGMEGRR